MDIYQLGTYLWDQSSDSSPEDQKDKETASTKTDKKKVSRKRGDISGTDIQSDKN